MTLRGGMVPFIILYVPIHDAVESRDVISPKVVFVLIDKMAERNPLNYPTYDSDTPVARWEPAGKDGDKSACQHHLQ